MNEPIRSVPFPSMLDDAYALRAAEIICALLSRRVMTARVDGLPLTSPEQFSLWLLRLSDTAAISTDLTDFMMKIT